MNVRCNKCYWTGTEDELKSLIDEDGYFLACPNCETDSYLMDLEDGEIVITDTAEYPNDTGLFYQNKGDIVCLYHDEVGQLGWFKIWYDAEMSEREYITVNNTIMYLDTIEEL
jgi:hypothetical protein